MNCKLVLICLFTGASLTAQIRNENQSVPKDSIKTQVLDEIVITASKKSESMLRSSVSIEQLKSADVKNLGAPTAFDALENVKGVQVITPSLGFKVINMRGFANTTNVRFTQLVDGVDNQAPHIGAPIANALGANDLDVDKIELIPGIASALYGLNAINGLANIRTKNPFEYQGITVQQLSGVNHIGNIDDLSPQPYLQTNLRYAKAVSSKFAFKMNGSVTKAMDWVADNRADLASSLNASTNLTGGDNPAFDEVNSYGNESPNRKTLTLNGKKYVVARTGYREKDITDYGVQNYKGDVGLYFRPQKGHELSITYKGALINTVYQRTNRFRLEDYTLGQYTLDYHSDIFQIRTYLTKENTGKSYNIRSLAENMDRAFKSDTNWFADYTTQYNNAISAGESIAKAHSTARQIADADRYTPNTENFNQKKNELTDINNWDIGAALRVKSKLFHCEGLLNWDKVMPSFFTKIKTQVLSGFDYRTYIIVPDGNYFINPVEGSKNLTYGKSGGFLQINKSLLNNKLKLSATLRADKTDYFEWKFNPRFTAVYTAKEKISIRSSYQSGYRFPSIFEGFSNVNSGGVKRVGGLPVMSNGIFENSYTKSSIDTFQARVNNDVNTLGLTQTQAIDKNKNLLKKNPYTYMQPEYVCSLELGVKGIILKDKLFFDVDFYYNAYDNFIAQVEANIPNTTNPDAIPTALYDKTTQSRYRLWTNSKSKIYNYGSSLGLKYAFNSKYALTGNCTYAKLDRTDNKDGLEDGFNTPNYMVNSTFIAQNIWKNLGASFTCRYQTKYNYVSSLVSGEVPSFYTLDGQVNYNFEKTSLFVKLGATNFTNKTYYNMLGGASVGALCYLSLTWWVIK